jgi:hypothetical protein
LSTICSNIHIQKYLQKQKDLKKEIVNPYFSVNGKTLLFTKFQLSDAHLSNTDRALGLLFFVENARRQMAKTLFSSKFQLSNTQLLNTGQCAQSVVFCGKCKAPKNQIFDNFIKCHGMVKNGNKNNSNTKKNQK